jgi:acyl dehydratase
LAKSSLIPLATEYYLTSDSNPSLYHPPSTNESYSSVSGDFNPIHMNPYFASYASLPFGAFFVALPSLQTRGHEAFLAATPVWSRAVSKAVSLCNVAYI